MMPKEIILADSLGYCWGVRRTLAIIEAMAARERPIATIGDVIHNPHVVERLRQQGVQVVASLDEARAGGFDRAATTAHGAGPERGPEAAARGLELIDTTCPLVARVQRLARKLVQQGYYVLIYGDAAHPEARGILGWAGTRRAVVAKRLEDLPWADPAADIPVPRKVAIVSQTTKQVDDFLAFAHAVTDLVARDGGEARICNTICAPTRERQNALKRLAHAVDVIVVVGGKKSSNTARLAEVGRSLGVPSFHIERPEDLDDAWLGGRQRVGVTAGASTPDDVILAVVAALEARGYRAVNGLPPRDDADATPDD